MLRVVAYLLAYALLPFSFPLRKSVDFRQLSCPSAPPAAMMMTAMITGFFVLSSGFGLSSGWHVHPPTCLTRQIQPVNKNYIKSYIIVRISIISNHWFLVIIFIRYENYVDQTIIKYTCCRLKILYRIVFDSMLSISNWNKIQRAAQTRWLNAWQSYLEIKGLLHS